MEANTDPDPIRIQPFPPVNKRSLTVRFHNEAYYVTPCSSVSEKKINIQPKEEVIVVL
jgi:hypothetical protein